MVKAPYSGNPYWNILHNFFILLCPVHIHRTVVNLFNMKKDSTISFFVIVQTFLSSVHHSSLEAKRNPPKGTYHRITGCFLMDIFGLLEWFPRSNLTL